MPCLETLPGEPAVYIKGGTPVCVKQNDLQLVLIFSTLFALLKFITIEIVQY
jgi:coproporphyrinogen III oxidase-like Fe-S oxidoreductase